jgi:hypothetical protein
MKNTAFFTFGQDPPPAQQSELNLDGISKQPIRDANDSHGNGVSNGSVTNVTPTEVSERASFIQRQLVPMRVSFGGARLLIPTPEESWFSTGGPPWCTTCNESLRFVFVTAAEAKTSTAGSYQTPKYIRCACFRPAETTRAPIPIEVIPTAASPDQPGQTGGLINELIEAKPEIVPSNEEAPQHTVAGFEEWLQQQEAKSETDNE